MTYKILIATPQPEFGELVRLNIEEGGEYEAISVKTGREVMEMANANKFDLVILDASITDKPFVPIAQNLMDENPSIKIIVIPPNNDPQDPSLEEIIYHGLLSRPFYPPDLVEMVNEILKSPPGAKAVPEKPDLEEESTHPFSETMGLEDIANILSEAANPPQIISEILSGSLDESSGIPVKEEKIGPINEEDFAKEVEALFAQEGIKKSTNNTTHEIEAPVEPQMDEPIHVVENNQDLAENQPLSVESSASTDTTEPIETPEEDTDALTQKLLAQIYAQTESPHDDYGLVEEAEVLLSQPEMAQSPDLEAAQPVVNKDIIDETPQILDEPKVSIPPVQPVSISKDTTEGIDDEDANETYNELTQDDETLAKKHTDMSVRYNDLANEYLSLAKEHSDLAKRHAIIAEEKVRNARENSDMLAKKRELVSEIYQTQQSLKGIIHQTNARAAIILKSGEMVAQVGSFTREVFDEIGSTLIHYWDDDKRSDLIRFMHLQTDGSEQLLYASLIRDDFTLGLIYEPATSISLMRSQSTRIARHLADEPLIDLLKLPINELESLSKVQNGDENYEWVAESSDEDQESNTSGIDNLSPEEVFKNVLSQLQNQAINSSELPMDLSDFQIDSEVNSIEEKSNEESHFDESDSASFSGIMSQWNTNAESPENGDISEDDNVDTLAILQAVNNQLDSQLIPSSTDNISDEFNETTLENESYNPNQSQAHSIYQNVLSRLSDGPSLGEDFFDNNELEDILFPWDEEFPEPAGNTSPIKTISNPPYSISQTQPVNIKASYSESKDMLSSADQEPTPDSDINGPDEDGDNENPEENGFKPEIFTIPNSLEDSENKTHPSFNNILEDKIISNNQSESGLLNLAKDLQGADSQNLPYLQEQQEINDLTEKQSTSQKNKDSIIKGDSEKLLKKGSQKIKLDSQDNFPDYQKMTDASGNEEPDQKLPANKLLSYHTYSCVLLPRDPGAQLSSEISLTLSEQMTEITSVFGWQLINLDIQPDYIILSMHVLPSVTISSMVRLIRQRTSKRLFSHYSQFSGLIDSGDFWATEYLSTNNAKPPSNSTITEFIKKTRRRQEKINA